MWACGLVLLLGDLLNHVLANHVIEDGVQDIGLDSALFGQDFKACWGVSSFDEDLEDVVLLTNICKCTWKSLLDMRTRYGHDGLTYREHETANSLIRAIKCGSCLGTELLDGYLALGKRVGILDQGIQLSYEQSKI